MKDTHSLTGYIARQSLISAASSPTTIAKPVDGSGFETRAVRGDLQSSMHGALRNAADETDLFVMDLLVERFGVLELPGGSYCTRTPNMKNSGAIDDLWETVPHVRMGSEAHFSLWKDAAAKLVEVLTFSGLLTRTLLIETPWAGVTDAGEPVKRYAGWSPEHAAELYAPYYSFMKTLGVASVRLPDELAISTEQHKWGASPYHYAPPAYEWMRDQMKLALVAFSSRR